MIKNAGVKKRFIQRNAQLNGMSIMLTYQSMKGFFSALKQHMNAKFINITATLAGNVTLMQFRINLSTP